MLFSTIFVVPMLSKIKKRVVGNWGGVKFELLRTGELADDGRTSQETNCKRAAFIPLDATKSLVKVWQDLEQDLRRSRANTGCVTVTVAETRDSTKRRASRRRTWRFGGGDCIQERVLCHLFDLARANKKPKGFLCCVH